MNLAPCFGYCQKCNTTHSLPSGKAHIEALNLMNQLISSERLDFETPLCNADPRCDLSYLFGEARGQMFGVLECESSSGESLFLKAFSCQYNSMWQIPAWVDPLINVAEYTDIMNTGDKKIKELNKIIADTNDKTYKKERKELSQQLQKELHGLYRFHNFCGETARLDEAFAENRGIPTGTGDCCAPKLLNHAAIHGLRPRSIAEFYLGKSNRSETRHQGYFYPSCDTKCVPILGFLLCGYENL